MLKPEIPPLPIRPPWIANISPTKETPSPSPIQERVPSLSASERCSAFLEQYGYKELSSGLISFAHPEFSFGELLNAGQQICAERWGICAIDPVWLRIWERDRAFTERQSLRCEVELLRDDRSLELNSPRERRERLAEQGLCLPSAAAFAAAHTLHLCATGESPIFDEYVESAGGVFFLPRFPSRERGERPGLTIVTTLPVANRRFESEDPAAGINIRLKVSSLHGYERLSSPRDL